MLHEERDHAAALARVPPGAAARQRRGPEGRTGSKSSAMRVGVRSAGGPCAHEVDKQALVQVAPADGEAELHRRNSKANKHPFSLCVLERTEALARLSCTLNMRNRGGNAPSTTCPTKRARDSGQRC